MNRIFPRLGIPYHDSISPDTALKFQIGRAGVTAGDPTTHGQVAGKAKRVRAVLSWALEHDDQGGRRFVVLLLSAVRAHGGFREGAQNYVGRDAIDNAIAAFAAEGYELSTSGELRPVLLDNLSGPALTDALKAYIRRAKRGADDAALVTGTGKDLLESVAAHILQEKIGTYDSGWNFPMLLGQTFIALGLATPQHPPSAGEPHMCRVERAFFELACAINQLRNRQGTGHGRPWLPSVTPDEARIAIESMGNVSEYLLMKHR